MSGRTQSLDFSRIAYLINPELFKSTRITVVGLGSGGAAACDHLVMNGIKLLELYDPDILDYVDLVKHPRMRKDIGRFKVDIQKEWIKDRNPDSEVLTYTQDVMLSKDFSESVGRSDLVLSCPDTKAVREFVSDQCTKLKIPFVTASVFRTGIGGEVFGYIPGKTGCYRCLQLYSYLNGLNLSDQDLGLTEEERDRIYGLGEVDFHASGLSLDIQMIALIQVRMALSIITRGSTNMLPKIKSNWIIFGNRPARGIFNKYFEVKRMLLLPQELCDCA